MHFWKDVLSEVENKKSLSLPIPHRIRVQRTVEQTSTITKRTEAKYYYLGAQYPNLYLTRREGECFFWLAHNLTIVETAYKMYLSPRTVEFYVKKMKEKLQCRSKKILLESIINTTNVLDQLKADGMKIVAH